MTQVSPRKPQQNDQSSGTSSDMTKVKPSQKENNPISSTSVVSPSRNTRSLASWWPVKLVQWWERKSRSVGFKTTLTAIALVVIPVSALGELVSRNFSDNFQETIIEKQKSELLSAKEKIEIYMNDRYGDIEALSQLVESSSAFTSGEITALNQELKRFQKTHPSFDSIAIFNNAGNPIAQTDGKPLGNHLDRSYIQASKQAEGIFISEPLFSQSEGSFSIYFANVLTNSAGQNVGFIRSRVPVKRIQEILTTNIQRIDGQENTIYLVNNAGQLFFSSKSELIKQGNDSDNNTEQNQENLQTVFINQVLPKLEQIYQKELEKPEDQIRKVLTFKDYNSLENGEQFIAQTDLALEFPNNTFSWDVIIGIDDDILFDSFRGSANFTFFATLTATLLSGFIAFVLAQKIVIPIERTSKDVKKISEGNLDQQVAVEGKDEIAQLGFSINQMTAQLKNLLSEQQSFARQSDMLKNITLEMTKAFNVNEVFEIAVNQIREALNSDRVIVYTFDEDWKGTIIAESVDRKFPRTLRAKIYDPCFADKYVEKYLSGRVKSTPDIYKAGLTNCHLKQLEPFGVKANLVAPIVASGKLLGLLISHQCSSPRVWTAQEIDFLGQTATNMSPALERVMLLETQQLDTFLAQQLKDITFTIAESLNREKVFDVAITYGRQALQCDRVIIYTFDKDYKGTIIAESVDEKYPKTLGANIKDPCFADKYVKQYIQGRVQATNDIYNAGLTKCHIDQLEPFKVRANLVTPIVVDGDLLGLLIAHQCDAPRNWAASEANFLAQLATQIGPALERLNLLEKQRQAELEQRQAKEGIQQRALQLLMQVDPVSQGDLTIRGNSNGG